MWWLRWHQEPDDAQAQENVYNVTSRDGVSWSLWTARIRRVLGDFKPLISDNVTGHEQDSFRRTISDRIERIAPFLRLDRDRYLVVNDGRLIWLQDAYTVSDCCRTCTKTRRPDQLYP